MEWDLAYRFRGTLGSILRCYHVDRDRTFSLLYDRLKLFPADSDAGESVCR